MNRGPGVRRPSVAMLAFALIAHAAPAGAEDYRTDIQAHLIEPCFLHLAARQPREGVSPEAMAKTMLLLNAEALSDLVDSIDRQLESDPPAAARRQIYRVALRACLRQGTLNRPR